MKPKMLFAIGLLAAASVPAIAQEKVIRAITALPSNNEMTRRFEAYVDLVNTSGEGVVRIDVIGGPEAIPGPQQDTALRNGVVDMQSGPAAYYAGTVPEVEALRGATATVAEARENGAFELLGDAWRDKLGAELISWISGKVPYYVFLTAEPKFDADGELDLSGLDMRSVPTYRDWFEMLGGTNVILEQSEIFSALERGIVDGFGWIAFSEDLGVNDLIKARVGPGVWQVNAVVMMNEKAYTALDDEAKSILVEAAIALEDANVEYLATRMGEETAALAAAGVAIVDIEGEAGVRHVRAAHELIWNELAESSPEVASQLRPLLYPDQ